ncbi:MAG: RNA-protein complex protein Nop10 [Candidatus Altiarchaeota archaeon]|nr:RNA-protein complex protein Nop10 [Candidatus Altiarchaeota archaeon]
MRIMKCPSCGTYTLETSCPKCALKTFHAQPPKYSPEDKYGKYRRMMKKAME